MSAGLDRAGYLAQGVLIVPPAVAATIVALFDVTIEAELTALRGRLNDQALADARAWWAAHRGAAAGFAAEPPKPARPALVVESRHEVSSDDAAAVLGVSAQYVRRLCRDGRLDGRQVAGRWLIDKSSLLALSERREPGAA